MKTIKEFFKSFFKKNNEYVRGTTGYGHDHEWDEHKKKDWVYCWICGDERHYKDIQKDY